MGHRPDLQSKLFGRLRCRDLEHTVMHNLSWFAAFHRVLGQSVDIRGSPLDQESMFPMLYNLRCRAISISGEL
jgi:hypothetical protein